MSNSQAQLCGGGDGGNQSGWGRSFALTTEHHTGPWSDSERRDGRLRAVTWPSLMPSGEEKRWATRQPRGHRIDRKLNQKGPTRKLVTWTCGWQLQRWQSQRTDRSSVDIDGQLLQGLCRAACERREYWAVRQRCSRSSQLDWRRWWAKQTQHRTTEVPDMHVTWHEAGA